MAELGRHLPQPATDAAKELSAEEFWPLNYCLGTE